MSVHVADDSIVLQETPSPTSSTALSADVPLTRICGQRDAALQTMERAIEMIRQGHELAEQARSMAAEASGGTTFHLVDRRKEGAYRRLFEAFEPERSAEVFRKASDAAIWVHLLRITGMETLMDATAREEFLQQLSADVPEVTEDNVQATMVALVGDADLIFQRGLARAFSDLDRRFKSHDAFKLGARIILTNVFDSWGMLNYYGSAGKTVQDVERVLAVLDGEQPEPGALMAAVKESREGAWGPRQGTAETRYLRIRTFKNGNAHLWFTRDDLVQKANQVLADYYGEVLPDAVPREDEELRTSGVPAKNLSFYATPEPVVERLVSNLHVPVGARILEPSAGEGHIVRALVAHCFQVDAVEIDAARVQVLGQISGLTVLPGNFLQMPARPEYAAVVMNPPFYGTHWMEHVLHAFDFLAPGGTLLAVLPATAEIGQSKKHERFRTWAAQHSGWRLRFMDLPPESFAASGTRISTVILRLTKARA